MGVLALIWAELLVRIHPFHWTHYFLMILFLLIPMLWMDSFVSWSEMIFQEKRKKRSQVLLKMTRGKVQFLPGPFRWFWWFRWHHHWWLWFWWRGISSSSIRWSRKVFYFCSRSEVRFFLASPTKSFPKTFIIKVFIGVKTWWNQSLVVCHWHCRESYSYRRREKLPCNSNSSLSFAIAALRVFVRFLISCFHINLQFPLDWLLICLYFLTILLSRLYLTMMTSKNSFAEAARWFFEGLSQDLGFLKLTNNCEADEGKFYKHFDFDLHEEDSAASITVKGFQKSWKIRTTVSSQM